MRHAMILFVALSLLVACKQELTKDKIELYAAVAFVTWGMEEGNNKFSAERVDRNILPDAVEYVVFSKKDDPAPMRMTIKSPKECVFTIRGKWTDGTLEILDFNKATNFQFVSSGFFLAYSEIEGPQVYCEGSKCEDEKMFFMLEQRGSVELEENRAIAIRKMRAVDFIRKSCPGKPF